MEFENKTYIITGATSGIGRCVATELAKSGARLLLLGRDENRLNEIKYQLDSIGELASEVALFDSNDLNSIELAVSKFADKFKFNGLIHCAGILYPTLLRNLNLDKMSELININLLSFFALAKATLKHNRYIKNDTSIVAISSLAAFGSEPGLSLYSASKAALNSAIKSLAKEYAKKGVRINAVAPLYVNTPMYDDFINNFKIIIRYFEVIPFTAIIRVHFFDSLTKAIIFFYSFCCHVSFFYSFYYFHFFYC